MAITRRGCGRFAAGGAIALLAMLCASSAQGASTPWVLKGVKLLNGGPQYMQVVEQNITPRGGTVVLNVSGDAGGTCKGGMTQMRFTWTFDKDVSTVYPGEQFTASLRAEQGPTTPSCQNELSYRTYASVNAGRAGTPISAWQGPKPDTRFDDDRFQTPYGHGLEQATPLPGAPNYFANNLIQVSDLEPYPDRRAAYFPFFVGTPAGHLAFIYVYEPASGAITPPPTQPVPPTPPTVPPTMPTVPQEVPPTTQTVPPPINPPRQELTSFGQPEQRDASGRITREAANIHVMQCPSGVQIYVYQYLNRPGFRAIRPPDWGHPLGGRDFETQDQAVAAGCGAAR